MARSVNSMTLVQPARPADVIEPPTTRLVGPLVRGGLALRTTSAGGRSMTTVEVDAPTRTAATRHSPRNQEIRGSLMTRASAVSNWGSSHSASRERFISWMQARPASNHAPGRASPGWTWTRPSSSSWKATAHSGSPKPLGLVLSAATSGSGTWSPMCLRIPDIRLVPLRPGPATNTICRVASAGSGVAATLRSPSVRVSSRTASSAGRSSIDSTSKGIGGGACRCRARPATRRRISRQGARTAMRVGLAGRVPDTIASALHPFPGRPRRPHGPRSPIVGGLRDRRPAAGPGRRDGEVRDQHTRWGAAAARASCPPARGRLATRPIPGASGSRSGWWTSTTSCCTRHT